MRVAPSVTLNYQHARNRVAVRGRTLELLSIVRQEVASFGGRGQTEDSTGVPRGRIYLHHAICQGKVTAVRLCHRICRAILANLLVHILDKGSRHVITYTLANLQQ